MNSGSNSQMPYQNWNKAYDFKTKEIFEEADIKEKQALLNMHFKERID